MELLELIEIGSLWRILANREATERLYLETPPARTEDCRCRFCKNYLLALPEAPAPFTELVSRLGFDQRKDRAIGLARLEDDRPVYSGRFVAVAELVAGKDGFEPDPNRSGAFHIRLRKAIDGLELALHQWRRGPEPRLDVFYHVRLPWLLEDDVRTVPEWLHGVHREPAETIFDAGE